MAFKNISSLIFFQKRLVIHSAVWLLFILINSGLYSFGHPEISFNEYLLDSVISLPIIFLFTYLTVYLLIPGILFKKKTFTFIIFFLALLIFCGFLEILKTNFIVIPLSQSEVLTKYPFNVFTVSHGAFFILVPAIYFTTLKFSRDWYKVRVLESEEEKKNLKNELNLLKSQVHPHFLLITLSNLESIARKNPKDAAPGIEKISEILNFILYECNVPNVRLSKELEQIQSFIELQKLNFSDKPEINYSIIGPTIEVRLAPLMLFTAVEFFFKNPPVDSSEKLKLSLFIEIFRNNLLFMVESENFNLTEDDFTNDPGITNLRKRISLLYNGKGHLTFKKIASKSIVQLNLIYE